MRSKWILFVLMAAGLCPIFLGLKGLSIFLGALWGAANLFLLKHLITQMLIPQRKAYGRLIFLGCLKCPLLYAAGYALLKVPYLDRSYLLIGFSVVIFMLILLGFKVTLLKRAG